MALVHDFPLSPADLFAVATDPDFLRARGARFGGVGEPELVEDGPDLVVRTRRQLPLDKIPGAVRSFVGDGTVLQEDRWTRPSPADDPVTATWRANVGNAPATLGGVHRIEGTATGSRYTLTVDVRVNVPLIGRKLEGQVSGFISSLIGKELQFLAGWVDEHP